MSEQLGVGWFCWKIVHCMGSLIDVCTLLQKPDLVKLVWVFLGGRLYM